VAQREFLTKPYQRTYVLCGFLAHCAAVPEEYRYRGRNIGRSEILFVRQFIAEHPEMSRYALSRRLCELWQWKQANGALRDMVCRGLLLLLHRAGEIHLPATRVAYRGIRQSMSAPNRLCR
jgi:hypothetical protein